MAGLSGLSGLSGLGAIAGGVSFGDPVAGQTLITREAFDADRTAGSPGSFSGGCTGTLYGGMTCGPNWAEHATRRSAGLRYPTAAEAAASSTFFKGQFLVDNGGLAQSIMLGGWFRFGSGVAGAGGLRDLLSYYIGYAPIGIGAQWVSTNPRKIALGCGYGGFTEFGGPVEINCHQWYWLCVGVTWSGTTMRIKTGYMANGGTTITEFGDSGDRTETFNSGTYRFYLNNSIVGFQGSVVGRVGGLSLYAVTTMPVALTYPTEIAHPVEERTVYVIDPVNGDNSNVNGPWATDLGAETARKRAVFKGAYVPWKTDAGVDASFSSLANVAAKQAWGTAYNANTASRVPQGDIIEFVAGDHFLTEGLNFDQSCPGITIRGQDQNDPPTLYMDKLIDVGTVSWTDDGDNRWSTTEINDIVVRGGIWEKTSNDANGRIRRLPLYAVIDPVEANAFAFVRDYNGSYWTNDAPGTVYVNPYTATDPNDLAFYVTIALTNTHAITIDEGLVEDIAVAGGLQYTTDPGDQLFARYPFAVVGNSSVGQITVFHRCLAKEYGKHAFAFVSNSATHLAIRKDCETRSGPIGTPVAYVGFGTGAWSAFVDFSGAATIPSPTGIETVCINYGLIDIDNRCVVGSLTPEQSTLVSAYISHNNGGVNQFAFVGVYDYNFSNPVTTWFTAGGPWQDAVPHW